MKNISITTTGIVLVYGEAVEDHRYTKPFPEWMPEIVNRLNEALQLEANWDSYSGKPVTLEAASKGIELLILGIKHNVPKPHVAPTKQGGILLEWNNRSVALELEVAQDGKIGALYEMYSRYHKADIKEELAELPVMFARLQG